MSKFKVIVIPVEGDISLHEVKGDDGPNFKDMYKLLGCNTIEITGARKDNLSYDLYIDEEGRLKEGNQINDKATRYFNFWLEHEGRTTPIPNIIGDAALVDVTPINE